MIFEQTLTTFNRRFLFCRVMDWNQLVKEKVIKGLIIINHVLKQR